jgi:V-type H+-transporting ATPase subunit e
MTAALLLGTLFFIAMAAVGALTAPMWAKKHSGLIQLLSIVLAFCMWMSYALIYIAQMNPLIIPTRNLKAE